MKMRKIIPGEIPTKDFHQFMLGTVAPRPIAFVSTVDEDGNPNLAPFSFFNAFSSNPPIVVFSSNRRIGDNSTKDTLANIRATSECVINSVSYHIVRQMAVCSVDYPKDVSEFTKSGLTPLPSEYVKPCRVKESHAHMECRVRDVITLGEHGGAGHLIICDVLCIHLDEAVIDERGRIDPDKMDLMGRMGRAYYVRASGDAIHTVVQAYDKIPVGYDGLPESIRLSKHLNGNHIGLLAGMLEFPGEDVINPLALKEDVSHLIADKNLTALHMKAARLLDDEDVQQAAALLLIADRL
jgi:flavin reductase (DIM6/NTAB) family NADH-FMN oxidoreductase RutF